MFDRVRQSGGIGGAVSVVLVALALTEVVRADNYVGLSLWPREILLGAAVRVAAGAIEVAVLALVLWALAWCFGYRRGFVPVFKALAFLTPFVPGLVSLGDIDYLIEASLASAPAWRVAAFVALRTIMGLAVVWGVLLLVRGARQRLGLAVNRLVPLLSPVLPHRRPPRAGFFRAGLGPVRLSPDPPHWLALGTGDRGGLSRFTAR